MSRFYAFALATVVLGIGASAAQAGGFGISIGTHPGYYAGSGVTYYSGPSYGYYPAYVAPTYVAPPVVYSPAVVYPAPVYSYYSPRYYRGRTVYRSGPGFYRYRYRHW